MTTLWQDKGTFPGPTHINGRVVVAMVKLPTVPPEVAHQWLVVTEHRNGAFYDLMRATFDDGGYEAHLTHVSMDDYGDALATLFDVAKALV